MPGVEADGTVFWLLAGHQRRTAGGELAALYPLPDGLKIIQPPLNLFIGHGKISPQKHSMLPIAKMLGLCNN